MSATRSLPPRPCAARWKGARRRSGHGDTVTVTEAKFEGRLLLRQWAREGRVGGESWCFDTDHSGMMMA